MFHVKHPYLPYWAILIEMATLSLFAYYQRPQLQVHLQSLINPMFHVKHSPSLPIDWPREMFLAVSLRVFCRLEQPAMDLQQPVLGIKHFPIYHLAH